MLSLGEEVGFVRVLAFTFAVFMASSKGSGGDKGNEKEGKVHLRIRVVGLLIRSTQFGGPMAVIYLVSTDQ